MNTITKLLGIPSLFAAGLFFAGCYTQLQSMNDDEQASGDENTVSSSDTTDDSTSQAYFGDDGYRAWRFRTAFDYYSPSPYVWGASIAYDPWYDDYWSPWDPWYVSGYWYPTLVYPYPYWYPRYGGYHYFGGYYGGYYGGGYGRGGGFAHDGGFASGRRRLVGATRGDDGLYRQRGGVRGSSSLPVASGTTTDRARPTAPPTASPAPATSRTRGRQEIPWWERMKSSTNVASARTRVEGNRSSDARQLPRGTVARQQQMRGRYNRAYSGGRRGSERPQQAPRQGVRRESVHSSPAPRSGGSGTSAGRSSGGRSRKD